MNAIPHYTVIDTAKSNFTDKVEILQARYALGDRVQHPLLEYRGVVLDVDPEFSHDEKWYEEQSATKPSKSQPWYQVLVHDSDQVTYVPEQNLEPDFSKEAIDHPILSLCFDRDENGQYQHRQSFQ